MNRSNEQTVIKRLDSSVPSDVLKKSAVTNYWLEKRFREMWKAFRPGFSLVLPKMYNPFDQEEIRKKFQLKGFEYGNWLNQEDRYNYLLACEIALFDLQNILRFGYNLGLGKHVGIAFGARGQSSAKAHYEPDTEMINLTRFKEAKKLVNPFTGVPIFGNKTTDQVKDLLFEKTGGVGSLGHEYGHALDYFFGTYVEQDSRYKRYRSLTAGRSVSQNPDIDYPKNSFRYDANMIIHKLIWADINNHTAFYKFLKEQVDNEKISEYWIRHNELFARSFEVYLNVKMKEKGITNAFLVKNKYDGLWPYPSGKTLQAVVPHFDSLISKMRQKIK